MQTTQSDSKSSRPKETSCTRTWARHCTNSNGDPDLKETGRTKPRRNSRSSTRQTLENELFKETKKNDRIPLRSLRYSRRWLNRGSLKCSHRYNRDIKTRRKRENKLLMTLIVKIMKCLRKLLLLTTFNQ